jgi:hypothetical protein
MIITMAIMFINGYYYNMAIDVSQRYRVANNTRIIIR